MNSPSAKKPGAGRKLPFHSLATLAVVGAVALSNLIGAEPPAPAARSILDGVFSAEQVVRGRRGYNALCARCHGEALGGGEDSPALVDDPFLNSWYGKSLGELIEYTREEMPSDGPGKVTRKQSTDITAYVLSLNGFPTGTAELVPEVESLNQIQIVRKK